MARPGREHWQGVKRIFRYLRGTTDIGLVYGNGKECLVTGYSDSDYAADVDTRRSMTGTNFLRRVTSIALACVKQTAVERTTMSRIVTELKECLEMELNEMGT
uniref:Uncharacterized protein n=1 Tax=Chenopodium quinoa TaxID=63459 RepID=A0A803MM07_CHEQI